MNLSFTNICSKYILARESQSRIGIDIPDEPDVPNALPNINLNEHICAFNGSELAVRAFDNCLSCGTTFRGVEGKLPVTLEADSHKRIGYICADCAQIKTAVIG